MCPSMLMSQALRYLFTRNSAEYLCPLWGDCIISILDPKMMQFHIYLIIPLLVYKDEEYMLQMMMIDDDDDGADDDDDDDDAADDG